MRWRWAVASLATMGLMVLPAALPIAVTAVTASMFQKGTVPLLLLAVTALWAWPASVESGAPRRPAWRFAIGATVALACGLWTAWRLLPIIFMGPLDPNRGDMLVVIDLGVKEFLAGRMPYRLYQVPWDVPLPYGPALWLPFVMPAIAHADLRVLTLLAYIFVTAAGLLTAALSITRRQLLPALCVAGLGIAFASQPDVASFYPIAHTPVYWPLLVVFCFLFRTERYVAAAAILGLLVCARSTMVSIVPIFVISLYYRGSLKRSVIAALLLGAVGPFLPFLLRDADAVKYGLVGQYFQHVKTVVWEEHRRWVLHTYGLTGWLLDRGLDRYVEVAQLASLAVFYALAWRSLARRVQPEAWMALALMVFSMTTLWPVLYIYFDVWVLLIAGLASVAGASCLRTRRYAVAIVAASLIVAAAAIGAVGAVRPGASLLVDVGSRAAAGLTGGGFGNDEAVHEGDHEFVWVQGTTARIRLPRAGWTPAEIRLDVRPFDSNAVPRQTVSASLNGKALGSVGLDTGWQTIHFQTRARQWNYGFNVLDLYLGAAAPDAVSGRLFSVGIDRVVVGRAR